MKKSMRVMMCLLLVMLMVAVMAVPAMAAQGSGSYEGYAFAWTITHDDVSGSAYIHSTGSPAYLQAEAVNNLYYDLENVRGTARVISEVGYAQALATAGNLMEIQTVTVRAEVVSTVGSFWLNGIKVVESAIDG